MTDTKRAIAARLLGVQPYKWAMGQDYSEWGQWYHIHTTDSMASYTSHLMRHIQQVASHNSRMLLTLLDIQGNQEAKVTHDYVDW
jgi:enoyl reductase-like protein